MSALRNSRGPLRGIVNVGFRAAATAAGLVVSLLLVWVVASLAWRGVSAASVLASSPAISQATPGILHALAGSLLVVAVAFVIAVPLGFVAGVYLAEAYQRSPMLIAVRFVADVLSGMPSIVVGVCVCLLMTRVGASAGFFAGSLSLGILLLPMIACTTTKTLNEASPSLREAALALGTPPWRFLLQISLRAAAPGILSAGLLCVARVAGEVAPLLLTLGRATPHDPSHSPIPTLQVEAYRNLLSPDLHAQSHAWTAALVLTVGVFGMVLVARRLGRGRQ